jgi:hypothetical protein
MATACWMDIYHPAAMGLCWFPAVVGSCKHEATANQAPCSRTCYSVLLLAAFVFLFQNCYRISSHCLEQLLNPQ